MSFFRKYIPDDPSEWEEYHRQYREARKTWSIIPYEEIIKRIRELSPRLQIGDFGCGEDSIAEAIGKERVYSFDHIAINVIMEIVLKTLKGLKALQQRWLILLIICILKTMIK